ncbi:VWA domain-containing protein [Myxococcus sp. CA051A]|uniref:VWA domain-containing protein n=1 Tax=unclassified Myxococcus TaxID=2648731 RepID=UPI00157B6F1E|nr:MULTISPECIES: VWA domain-containing protein [unclassified Myxococcus]NTX51762.1 VWA domain-containing protein [Myxococcus sp. CA039A]NTX62031.1 VWA domain-containing protein [Myxococcus sp. CA051A]
MAYSAEISRTAPACILLLIDQSGSMDDPFGGPGGSRKKAEGVADVTNRLLQNLVVRCAREEGIRDYFHLGVLGYGERVGSAFSGPLAGRGLVPISEIGHAPARLEERTREREDGMGGLVREKVRFPVWFEPVAHGPTPMCEVLSRASSLVGDWLREHPEGFPPIVVNVSDGQPTDGDPTAVASSLRALRSSDGAVLLLNVHLSSNPATPIQFPDAEVGLPDAHARLLFDLSSPLTPGMLAAAREEGQAVREGARGFAFNADIVSLIKFLNIGTRPSNLR